MSLEVVGALGGASRQAVSKSGSPARWVMARLRRALLPCGRGPGGPERAYQVARAAAGEHLAAAAARVRALPEPRRGGRPAARDPGALAAMLGVAAGGDLLAVYGRWVAAQLARLRGKLELCRGLRGWRRTRRWLDGWLPRWVRRTVGARPPFRKTAPATSAAGSAGSAGRAPPAAPGRIRPLYPQMFRGLI